jgi:hypothetical protein
MELEINSMVIKSKTYCEKWPIGCQTCDLTLCDAKKDTHEMTSISNVDIPGEIVSFEYEHRCVPCNPTQPECGECEFAKPITNADRIRDMTDEELAEFCFCITDDVASYYGGDGYEQKYPVASKGWLDWLRQEANDVGQ